MKKKYEKPGLYIENFAVSQYIATDCGFDREHDTNGKPNMGDNSSCGWDMGGVITWIGSNTKFNSFEDPDTPLEVYCYNNVSGGLNAFNYS